MDRHARIYARLKAVCCSSWGCSPAEFDVWADAEAVAAEDVLETVLLRSHEPLGANIYAFIYREQEFENRRRLEELKRLVTALRLERDPARRAALEDRIREVNGGS